MYYIRDKFKLLQLQCRGLLTPAKEHPIVLNATTSPVHISDNTIRGAAAPKCSPGQSSKISLDGRVASTGAEVASEALYASPFRMPCALLSA